MTNSARTEEIRARVELMADPKQKKWDLSPNDQAALRHLLTELTALREEVERLKGALENIATALDDAQIGKAGLICIAALSQKAAENERHMVGD